MLLNIRVVFHPNSLDLSYNKIVALLLQRCIVKRMAVIKYGLVSWMLRGSITMEYIF